MAKQVKHIQGSQTDDELLVEAAHATFCAYFGREPTEEETRIVAPYVKLLIVRFKQLRKGGR